MLDKVSEKNKKKKITGGKTRERRSDSEENAAHSGWSLNELRSIIVWKEYGETRQRVRVIQDGI